MILFQSALFLAGFFQGFLLTTIPITADAIRKFSGRAAQPRSRTLDNTLAILLSLLPGLLFFAAAYLGLLGVAGRGFVLGVFPGLFVGSWSRGRSLQRRDSIEGMLAVTKQPPVAIFARFVNQDAQFDQFMDALGDPATKKLWRKFQSIPVDLDQDGEMLAKYGIDRERGIQAMFFHKDGSRIDFDGNDRIFAEDMLDPRRFETRLQTAFHRWDLS